MNKPKKDITRTSYYCLLIMFFALSAEAQVLTTNLSFAHLGTAKLNGLGLEVGFGKMIKNQWHLGIRSQIIHVTGSRVFEYEEGKRYTISDNNRPETFYDPLAYPPGLLNFDAFIATFPLVPDRTTQIAYGVYCAFYLPVKNGQFEFRLSPSVLTVHEKYIASVNNVTFFNPLGTFQNVGLLSVFVNDYVDISMAAEMSYMLMREGKMKPALSMQLEYLFSGYLNYTIGIKLFFGNLDSALRDKS